MEKYSSLYKWYVYHLIDPRDNKVFYVGKGSGDRDKQHQIEVGTSKAINHAKCSKIDDILSSGLQVKRIRVAYFCCEITAYNFETEQIQSYKGLTNIARNKKRPTAISLFGEVRKAFLGEGDRHQIKRNLILFASAREALNDHKRLIACALKVIINQDDRFKVCSHG
jgi:hypothetical protein